MMSTRYCINTGQLVPLSVEYIISCDTLDYGCDGGHLSNTLEYAREAIPSTWHTNYIEKPIECIEEPINKGLSCENPIHLTSIEEMKQEIYQNGPIVANMVVFKDLLEYGSGVY